MKQVEIIDERGGHRAVPCRDGWLITNPAWPAGNGQAYRQKCPNFKGADRHGKGECEEGCFGEVWV